MGAQKDYETNKIALMWGTIVAGTVTNGSADDHSQGNKIKSTSIHHCHVFQMFKRNQNLDFL